MNLHALTKPQFDAAIQTAMQRHINEREALTVRDFDNGWSFPTSLAAQSAASNLAQFEVRRALFGVDNLRRMHFEARHQFYLCLHRYVMKARRLRLAAAGWEKGVINPKWDRQ